MGRLTAKPAPWSDVAHFDVGANTAFHADGQWDGKTRRIGVNARLFDNFDADQATVWVVEGKHLW